MVTVPFCDSLFLIPPGAINLDHAGSKMAALRRARKKRLLGISLGIRILKHLSAEFGNYWNYQYLIG